MGMEIGDLVIETCEFCNNDKICVTVKTSWHYFDIHICRECVTELKGNFEGEEGGTHAE